MTAAQAQNMRGAAYLTAGMGLFASADAFVKVMSPVLGSGGVLFVMSTGMLVLFLILSRARGQRLNWADFFHPWVVARGLGEVFATICVLTALAIGTLSSFTVIAQLLPLTITAAAALMLGEAVGWRRWSAILVGLAGTLVIVRPGAADFDAASLFALGGVLGMTVRDIGARSAPRRISSEALGIYAVCLLIPTGVVWSWLLPPAQGIALTPGTWLGMAAMTGLVAAAYLFMTNAMRIGEMSAVAPFRYTRLIFGLAIGYAAFGERIDGWTMLGSALILGAGLYAWVRETRAKTPLPAGAASD